MIACRLRPSWLIFLLACCTTIAVYWPSLHGGYIFDDGVYFLNNTDVHVTTLHLADWIRAALQQVGTGQFRALSMLSFAANYYFTGLDPFWPKLTNLVIHLLNGWLLFLLLRELLRFRQALTSPLGADEDRLGRIAALIAAAWLLLPINLTGVAYVAQRMEALANVFVFLGLFWYLRARRREFNGNCNGLTPAVAILVCILLGYGAKETAVLLPLYTACAEFALTGFRNADGKASRSAWWAHILFLGLPLLVGLAWISTWVLKSWATFRTFSIGQRLLTEPRVWVDYIHWTLLPNINNLTFNHDDLKASNGLLDPPTTLISILALLALAAVALWQRKQRPLFCLGTLWFFAGHMLTGTVIPLELVFEHRNYFPSSGLLLAAASLLALEPGLRSPFAKAVLTAAFLAWCSFTTFLRSEEWSDPMRLAYAEALKRPDSPRAQYDLANTLIRAAGKDSSSPLIERARAILEKNAFRSDSGIAPLQALIYLNSRAHRPIDPRWWSTIEARLRTGGPSQTDIGAVIFLSRCQRSGDCPAQTSQMLATFVAALEASGGDPNLMSAYADFAYDQLHDPDLALRMARAVVAAKPGIAVYRSNLVQFLILTGHFEEARKAIAELRQRDRGGSHQALIAYLIRLLTLARAQADDRAIQPAPAQREPAVLPAPTGSR